MKKIMAKFKKLSKSRKIQLIIAVMLTVGLMVIIPVYAWFASQKKAAEMFKVEYPNALYINAAHREDRINFKLDGININEYAVNPVTRKLIENEDGDPVKIEKMAYVFSVSGSNTTSFTLQLGYTTNNKFTYTVYEASQYSTSEAAMAAAGDNIDRIVRYKQNAGSHTENGLQIIGDEYVDDATSDLYYVRSTTALTGTFLNPGSSSGTAATTGKYYEDTYGDNTNVQLNAVPLYWQKTGIAVTSDSNKNFCKYFILEVTWDSEEQLLLEEKETDMIYFSVKRTN